MKTKYIPGIWLIALLISWPLVYAADMQPGKYELHIAEVDGASREFVFILGGSDSKGGGEIVFKSIEALQNRVAKLPRGSTLDWWSTCIDRGQSEFFKVADIKALKTTCIENDITFTMHPGG